MVRTWSNPLNSRKAACLDDLLGDFRGFLQTDAYVGYDSWADGKTDIARLACWAHARRKFHDAFKAGQTLAAGVLAAIQRLYQIEAALRPHRADPAERCRSAPTESENARDPDPTQSPEI